MKIGFIGNVAPPIGGAEVLLGQFLTHFLKDRSRRATLVRWRKQHFMYFPERVTRIYAPRGKVEQKGRLQTHYVFDALLRRKNERRSAYQQRVIEQYTKHGLESARIFRKEGMQLIHVHMLYPNLLFGAAAAKALSVPLILTIHGMLEFRILNHMRTRYPELADMVEGHIKDADCVVGVSDEIVKECRARGACNVQKIPSGVDTEFYSPNGKRNGNAKDILFVGSVRKDKGAPLLIEAFERASKSFEGNLVFVGKRLIHGVAYQRARRNRRIRFLGVQDKEGIKKAMHQSRLVVLPSVSEGLPLSILEAMANAKPVLATRTGGLTHLIAHENNGFHITKRTPVALAKQMEKILVRGDLEAIGKRGRETALRFDIRTIVHRYEDLYRSLLN